MKLFDRFLLALYTLGVMAALFAIGLAVAGWTTPVEMFRISLVHYNERLLVGALVIVFLILSVRFFLWALSGEKRVIQAVVHETGLGHVKISVEAIENLAFRAVNQIRGVREVKPRVVCLPEGIHLFIRVKLSPETNIPQTTDEIQARVSDYVSEVAGISLKSVKILVDGIASETKSGTPRKLN